MTYYKNQVFAPYRSFDDGDTFENCTFMEGTRFGEGSRFVDCVFIGKQGIPIVMGRNAIFHNSSFMYVTFGYANIVSDPYIDLGGNIKGQDGIYGGDVSYEHDGGVIKTNLPCQHEKKGDGETPVVDQCNTENKTHDQEVVEGNRD